MNFAHAVKNCATISSVRWPSAPKKLVFEKHKKKNKVLKYKSQAAVGGAAGCVCAKNHSLVYKPVCPLKLFNKSKPKETEIEKKRTRLKSEQQIPWDRKKIARTATIKA